MSWSQNPGVCSLLTRDDYPCTDAFWPRHAVEARMWGAASEWTQSLMEQVMFLFWIIKYFTPWSKFLQPHSAIMVLYWAHREMTDRNLSISGHKSEPLCIRNVIRQQSTVCSTLIIYVPCTQAFIDQTSNPTPLVGHMWAWMIRNTRSVFSSQSLTFPHSCKGIHF